MQLQTIEKILTFAIEEEDKAACFYRNLATKAKDPGLRESLLSFAAEEEQHKAALENVMAGDLSMFAIAGIDESVFMEEGNEPALSPGSMTVQQALRFAITAEQKAFRLYMTLATVSEDSGLKTIFKALAKQEATHSKQFEEVYDRLLVDN
jgi:rubrerythrin